MKNVRILDCTLRDGGRVIDCAFPDNEIKELSDKLSNAKIDIIEVGFLRDYKTTNYVGNSTFFTDVDQISNFVDRSKKNVLYVAFVDYGLFDFNSLKSYNGLSIDGIRFGFTKKNYKENYEDIIRCIDIIKSKGYKLFIQGVNSLSYTDIEILELVDMVNEIHPYSFGIVDTYGAMYIEDVDRIYRLIDHNMNSDICINFHSHNNYQLSFAFAQEIIKLSKGVRQIIIDATLGGMGKVAGNLNTELIVDYLIRKLYYDYNFDDILDMIDDYIYKYHQKYKWGYSIPGMMAGVYKSHPNNIIYLTEKFRLETKDISRLLSMIDPLDRQKYDYENIERLYTEYIADKIDDYDTICELRKILEGKNIFIIVPGNTLNTHKDIIEKYIMMNSPIIISVNFVTNYEGAYTFFGNKKRYVNLANNRGSKACIISSNIKPDCGENYIVDYQSLINRSFKYFENSTIMLLNLLKKVNPGKIAIAGFDGFSESGESNYVDTSFQNERHIHEFGSLNREIGEMFNEFVKTMNEKCEIEMITPSIYNVFLCRKK